MVSLTSNSIIKNNNLVIAREKSRRLSEFLLFH
uniref:Uncharacterized protein n=1 Tax=Cryptosporidium parvum TaxID=5807 RepID=F0X5X6_CRYPV